MRARTFDGSFDQIQLQGPAVSFTFSAQSFFAYIKPSSLPANGKPLSLDLSGARALGVTSSDGTLEWYDGTDGRTSTSKITAGAWWAVWFTKASGTTTGRFHLYNVATDSWTHENASGTNQDITGTFSNATIGDNSFGSQYFPGDIAAAALWNARALTDAEVVDATMSFAKLLTYQPYAAWLLDQESIATPVVDYMGHMAQSNIDGTTVADLRAPFRSGVELTSSADRTTFPKIPMRAAA